MKETNKLRTILESQKQFANLHSCKYVGIMVGSMVDDGLLPTIDALDRAQSRIEFLERALEQATSMGTYIVKNDDGKYATGRVPTIVCEGSECAASLLPHLAAWLKDRGEK